MWLTKIFDCILAFFYTGQRCEHDCEVNKLNLSSLNANWEKSYSDQLSHSVVSNSLWPHGLQHIRLPCPSLTPRPCSGSCPSSRWCHPTVSSSVIPFSSHLQSFPASGSFLMSQLFALGGRNIGGSSSVLPMNIQDLFPLGLTCLISLQSKGLSRVFSNTTVQKHQFFVSQLSLWSNWHIHDFPSGSDGKVSVYNAGDPGSIPGLGRSPGEGNGNPLQD